MLAGYCRAEHQDMTSIPTPTGSRRVGLDPPTVENWWQRSLVVGAITTIGSATLMMALGRFIGPSLIVLAVGTLLGLWLLPARGRAGLSLLMILAFANLLLHWPIVIMQLSVPEAPASLVTGTGLGLGSLLVLVSGIARWHGREGTARVLHAMQRMTVGALSIALVVGVTAFWTRASDRPQPTDLRLTNTGLRVSTHTLRSTAATTTVTVRNTDPLFPRSFAIARLDVHVLVPPRTTRRITFRSPPGTYRYTDDATATDATAGRLVVAR